MATYKAEFLVALLRGHACGRARRMRDGMDLPVGARRIRDRVTGELLHEHFAPFSAIIKAIGGIAQQRAIPRFASPTFRSWFHNRKPGVAGTRRVILWPDTFSNYLHPSAAIAAVEVLEHAGFVVNLPKRPLCCGRPLYDWGMLDTAKGLWRQTLDTLRDDIRAGVPIIGLEPSCVAAFRDELGGLFPDDDDAKRLARQTFMLSEFLVNEGYQPPALDRRAVVHGHCHHKAVVGMQAEEEMLRRLGLDYQVLDAGCCGMAGSFGFEAHKYDVSVQAAERVLLPAVRRADPEALIIANGFSCHEQIAQLSGKAPLHLAEVLRMALQGEAASSRATGEG